MDEESEMLVFSIDVSVDYEFFDYSYEQSWFSHAKKNSTGFFGR
jgi:hypothetical protein